MDHKLSELGIFFTQCVYIGLFGVWLRPAARERVFGTGRQICASHVQTSSKVNAYSPKYFPIPLFEFIGTNQIRGCLAYSRRPLTCVHLCTQNPNWPLPFQIRSLLSGLDARRSEVLVRGRNSFINLGFKIGGFLDQISFRPNHAFG